MDVKANLKKLKQLQNNKIFRYTALVFTILIVYKLYLWTHTESTDNAYVQADITMISSEISGKIIDIIVKDNTPVKKGDVLAHIDDTSYKAKLEQASLKLQAAEYAALITEQKILIEQTNSNKANSNLKLAQVKMDIGQRDYDRNLTLKKDQFSSASTLDQSKSKYEDAKNALEQAKFAVELSQENLEMLSTQKKSDLISIEEAKQEKIIAEHDMSNTVIISIVDGVTASSGLRVGNFVSPGMPLIYVVPNDLYIIANFKETQVALFKNGQEVEIEFDAVSGKYPGKIRNISPASGATFTLIPVDNATGNFTKIVQRVPVIIDFDHNLKGLENLGVGMSTSVKVDTR